MRALGLLMRTTGLWKYVLVPLALNAVLGAILYTSLMTLGFRWIDGLIVDTSSLGTALERLLRVVLGVALLLGIGFILVRFGVLLGSPWYAKLSEHIERMQTGQAPPAEPLTPAGIARDLGRALGFELKKLLIVVLIGGVLLLMNVVPVAGQIVATVGGIVLGGFIACLDFFDGPLERRRMRFRDKISTVRRALPASGGFGLMSFALVSIPLLNLLAIPVCVAAGTLFYSERIWQRQR